MKDEQRRDPEELYEMRAPVPVTDETRRHRYRLLRSRADGMQQDRVLS